MVNDHDVASPTLGCYAALYPSRKLAGANHNCGVFDATPTRKLAGPSLLTVAVNGVGGVEDAEVVVSPGQLTRWGYAMRIWGGVEDAEVVVSPRQLSRVGYTLRLWDGGVEDAGIVVSPGQLAPGVEMALRWRSVGDAIW